MFAVQRWLPFWLPRHSHQLGERSAEAVLHSATTETDVPLHRDKTKITATLSLFCIFSKHNGRYVDSPHASVQCPSINTTASWSRGLRFGLDSNSRRSGIKVSSDRTDAKASVKTVKHATHLVIPQYFLTISRLPLKLNSIYKCSYVTQGTQIQNCQNNSGVRMRLAWQNRTSCRHRHTVCRIHLQHHCE